MQRMHRTQADRHRETHMEGERAPRRAEIHKQPNAPPRQPTKIRLSRLRTRDERRRGGATGPGPGADRLCLHARARAVSVANPDRHMG